MITNQKTGLNVTLEKHAPSKTRNKKINKKRKELYCNIDTNVLIENGIIWKTVKPFLANKMKQCPEQL